MKVKIKRLETGYIVSVRIPKTAGKVKQPEPRNSWMIVGMFHEPSSDNGRYEEIQYCCKSLYEVCGLLEQLFQDSAFVAKDVMTCGELVAKKKQAAKKPSEPQKQEAK
jgi:hypothetical protein